ncbi:MAG: histidine kinase [Chitinophagaceae bacterium]
MKSFSKRVIRAVIIMTVIVSLPVIFTISQVLIRAFTHTSPIPSSTSLPANSRENSVSVILYLGSIIIFCMLLVVLGILLKTQQKEAQLSIAHEKAEKDKKLAEFQEKVATTALSALRAQMNPHFIFNCLNSIKLYTAENNAAAASAYMSKFARLMRLVLDNSKSDRIALATELEALELYIQLEVMRFKEKLQYEIIVAANTDLYSIEIPPLLIQPYVENAIWHGIMQKEATGNLFIHLSYEESENLLTIVVRDNGIGRTRSAALKTMAPVIERSHGMSITAERIDLLNQLHGTAIRVAVEDLYDDQQAAAGTIVVIQIPIS